jgi:hypothetical protein
MSNFLTYRAANLIGCIFPIIIRYLLVNENKKKNIFCYQVCNWAILPLFEIRKNHLRCIGNAIKIALYEGISELSEYVIKLHKQFKLTDFILRGVGGKCTSGYSAFFNLKCFTLFRILLNYTLITSTVQITMCA